MDANDLIEGLGKRIGIELKLDDDNSCAIEADGMAIIINYLGEIDILVLLADVGEPPPERLEMLYKTLLEANHLFTATAGATLSLDPKSGHVVLCRAIRCMAVGVDEFVSEVERFINTLEMWTSTVVAFRDEPKEGGDDDSGNANLSGLFIQV